MAGEIQLNGTSFASESGGTITVNNGTIGSSVVFPYGHFLDLCHFQHTESPGTSGGTSSASWATRTINTTKRSATWASLYSNAITLSAGTYWFNADPSANNSGRIMARL